MYEIACLQYQADELPLSLYNPQNPGPQPTTVNCCIYSILFDSGGELRYRVSDSMGARVALGLQFRTLIVTTLFVSGTTPLASAGANTAFDNPPHPPRNFSYLVQKAEQGDINAQFELGIAYASGVGAALNYSEALRWYRKAADSGHTGAENNLGVMYARGLGVPQNDCEAMKWYLRAATEGHPAAENNVGFMYASGRAALGQGKALSPDPQEALKWYHKAAVKAYAPAEFNLGMIYFQGAGTMQSFKEALKWFRKAAEHGSIAAEIQLGYVYEHGRGVIQDYNTAAKWYQIAAEHGSAEAQQSLRLLANLSQQSQH